MPIEIRELVIKATVKDEAEKKTNQITPSRNEASNEDQLVQRCVEQVLEILRQKEER